MYAFTRLVHNLRSVFLFLCSSPVTHLTRGALLVNHAIHSLAGATPLYQRDSVPELTAGTDGILLDELSCVGNETRLVECSSPTPIGILGARGCTHLEDAGVRCEARGICVWQDSRVIICMQPSIISITEEAFTCKF